MKPLSRIIALSFLSLPLVVTLGCNEDKKTAAREETKSRSGDTSSNIQAGNVLAKGAFAGASGHVMAGSVTVIKTAGGMEIRLSKNFSLDSGPDPWLGFGRNGRYEKAAEISKLGNLSGAQTYKLPASVDVSKYNEFYVWCKEFGVALGVARLN